MSDSQQLLEQAVEHHTSGRTEAVKWHYCAMLALDPEHAEAHGQLEPGLKHLRQATTPKVGGHCLERTRDAGLDHAVLNEIRRQIDSTATAAGMDQAAHGTRGS